jgi:hypothetical protein
MAKSGASNASHDEGRKGPALDDEQLLTKLRDLWSSHQRKDLEVRHAMGVLLNERLDDPNVRQEYGQQVIARVSKELGIHESDISRFRRFARDYESATAFLAKHPTCTTWTKARGMLAGRRRAVTGNRKIAGVLRSLQSAVTSLHDLDTIEDAKREQLFSAVQELVKLINDRLGVRLTDEAGDHPHEHKDRRVDQAAQAAV